MKNYSRQREAIVRMLSDTVSHPTAEEIYSAVKKDIPKVSLATVYRNLKELENAEDILTVKTEDGKLHYDGNVFPHAHLYCTECGKVSDVRLSSDEIAALKSIYPDGEFELTYRGVCEKCKSSKNRSQDL